MPSPQNAPHATPPTAKSGRDAVEVARDCAAAARDIIVAGFRQSAIGLKAHRDLVTETDVAAENAVIAILRSEYPDYRILAEESASKTDPDGWTWVVDPIDGTRNFVQGIPHFAFS